MTSKSVRSTMRRLTMKIQHIIIILAIWAAVATKSKICDDIKTIVNQNKHDWEKIRTAYPNPGILNHHSKVPKGINGFFVSLNRGNTKHLVVLMERSAKLGKSEFYLRQRKLVEDILRFHTDMDPDHLNSSVITFAVKGSYTPFNVTGSDKDMFFKNIWPNVTYEPDKAKGDVDMRFAFIAARQKFDQFEYPNNNNVTRLMLVLSSGEFTDSPDSITLTDLQNKVSIYVVQSGEGSEEGRERLRSLASEPEQYGTFIQWMNASWVFRPPGTVAPNSTCGPHGWGYMAGSPTFPACRCAWGYKGAHCKEDEDECAFDLCGASGECMHGIGTFACSCQDSICGCYCDETCAASELCAPWWVTFLVTLLLLIPLVVICLVLHHEPDIQTLGEIGAEPARYTMRWFMQRFVGMVRTKCSCKKTNGTSESSHNQYYPRPPNPVYRNPAVDRHVDRPLSNATQPVALSMGTSGAVRGQVGRTFQHVAASTGFQEPSHIVEERLAHNRRAARRRPLPDVPHTEEGEEGYEPVEQVPDIPTTMANISYGTESHTLEGMCPPSSLPDFDDFDEYEEETRHECEDRDYENMMVCRDMKLWRPYLCKVLSSGRLDSVCIMHRVLPGQQCIASDGCFLSSSHEAFDALGRGILDGIAGRSILFEKLSYTMSTDIEKGYYFVAINNADSESVVLCAACNSNYIVVGKRAHTSDRSKYMCRKNVLFMLDHLVSRSR